MDAEVIKRRIDTLCRAALGEETLSPELLRSTANKIKEMVDELDEERQEAEEEADDAKLNSGPVRAAVLNLIDELEDAETAVIECGRMLSQAKRSPNQELRDFASILDVLIGRLDNIKITQKARHIFEAAGG